jgi:hypothetical protein
MSVEEEETADLDDGKQEAVKKRKGNNRKRLKIQLGAGQAPHYIIISPFSSCVNPSNLLRTQKHF